MELNFWLILAQLINFGIIFFIFKKFLGDKLILLIKERRTDLKKLENVSDDVKEKMDKATLEADKIIEKAKEKIGEMEKSAELLAKQNKEKIINNANIEAKSIISGAKDEIEKEKLSMMNSIKTRVIGLSLKLNEKLFEKEKVNKDFMEKEINSINI